MELGREIGISVPPDAPKEKQLSVVGDAAIERLPDVLRAMARAELKSACRKNGIDDAGRSRDELIRRLLGKLGLATDGGSPAHRDPTTPEAGDIVSVRLRQYLVEQVVPPREEGDSPLVKLVCLDDDAQGRPMEVLWGLELGAKVLQLESAGLGDIDRFDPPRHFAAYLHALKWNCVTATDARLFQSPFRSGIKLMNHQLTPLKKALELPRVNLFIADDVGLGKTIEAGLVVQELVLRQRVDFALVICPASVCLQWRDEMERKFGLRFEIYDREFVGRRRRDRGFGVNPWKTHHRFVISYATLRRPEYFEPLLAHLGPRLEKSLLILDEAHTAAPASSSKYAVDSRITKVVRDVAPRFENRLFLSATPHNGHSNSFSSLLEILDPQRFTRGVPIRDPRRLEPVMVRRLKEDIREVSDESYPDRQVVPVRLEHAKGAWTARFDAGKAIELGAGDDAELELARLLTQYTKIARPAKGRGALVFVNLQKRLLSSIEAFYRTLSLHAENAGKKIASEAPRSSQLTLVPRVSPRPDEDDEDVRGEDDDAIDEREDAAIAAASIGFDPDKQAKALLDRMMDLARARRGAADAKALALLEWISQNLCEGVRLPGDEEPAKKSKKKPAWSDRRVLIFTEYGDTKRWLHQLLSAAVADTEDGENRILQLHGGMSDEKRDAVQRAFNSPPGKHPVRILLATDSAREGINLQGHCADLFHFDVPWNPARMEQRNGRIDRALQPAKVVRCHYFLYPQRREDPVLEKLVEKVKLIRKELGSLSAVIMSRYADTLEDRGIDDDAAERIEQAEAELRPRSDVSKSELEAQRLDLSRIKADVDAASKIFAASETVMEFRSELLRDAVDVGCELAGAAKLTATTVEDGDKKVEAFTLPKLPPAWDFTVDTLRPPRERDEAVWEWREKDPQPVVFRPPARMNASHVHLHLSHPFVQRIMSRFLSQGFSAHDLTRATVVKTSRDKITRVIAFGRLSLFGPGATRLHDELVPVAAQWLESGGAGHLRPFADRKADEAAIAQLEDVLREAPSLDDVGEKTRKRLLASAPGDFNVLWKAIEAEADERALQARRKLSLRGTEESAALKAILESQRRLIDAELSSQLTLFEPAESEQADQFKKDRDHMKKRLAAIEQEIETEPAAIESTYRVALKRLTPVGMIYLWPSTR